MPWFSAGVRADIGEGPSALASKTWNFTLRGSHFPSYGVFRDVLIAELFRAKRRVCILSERFEDRELAYALVNASRRSLSVHLRVEPKKFSAGVLPGRLGRVVDDLRSLGLTVLELPLSKLKLSEPTIVALDERAWSISQGLSEVIAVPVDVDAAPLTAAEVCGWAEAAVSAKATTRR